MHWNLKARLEAVEEDVETFEQAFLSHLVNPGTNLTVWEEITETGKITFSGLKQLPEHT